MFKMKKFLLSFAALIIFGFSANAQKVAYIDTEVILAAIPEYQAAQIELNELSDKYKACLLYTSQGYKELGPWRA